MGEIGINRTEYLYDLTYCDLVLIQRGYERRYCHLWSATRWETYNLLCAFVGGDKLAEKGIHHASDLIKFPWEREKAPIMTKEEHDKLQAEMAAFTFANSKSNEG